MTAPCKQAATAATLAGTPRTAASRGICELSAQETTQVVGGLLNPLDSVLPLIQGGGSPPPKKKG